VEHDPNWTIEVSGAEVERPAIIRFRKTGTNRYDYWIYEQGEAEHEASRWVLTTFRNPRRSRGRRWLVV
jgi:hypothetical protein